MCKKNIWQKLNIDKKNFNYVNLHDEKKLLPYIYNNNNWVYIESNYLVEGVDVATLPENCATPKSKSNLF